MKYKAIFLKKVGDSTYRKIGEKGFKSTDKTVSFSDSTFILPKDRNSFETNKESIVFFDFDNSKILNFIKTDMGINAKFLDKLIVRDILGKLVRQLRSSMEEPNKWKLMPFIITFIVGCVLGYLFGTNPAFKGG